MLAGFGTLWYSLCCSLVLVPLYNFISFLNLCGCQQSHFKEKVNGGFLFPAKKTISLFLLDLSNNKPLKKLPIAFLPNSLT